MKGQFFQVFYFGKCPFSLSGVVVSHTCHYSKRRRQGRLRSLQHLNGPASPRTAQRQGTNPGTLPSSAHRIWQEPRNSSISNDPHIRELNFNTNVSDSISQAENSLQEQTCYFKFRCEYVYRYYNEIEEIPHSLNNFQQLSPHFKISAWSIVRGLTSSISKSRL